MNTSLQSQFDRVEAALNSLIDSISAYNPSPPAAVALVAANDDLSHELDQRNTPRQPSITQEQHLLRNFYTSCNTSSKLSDYPLLPRAIRYPR